MVSRSFKHVNVAGYAIVSRIEQLCLIEFMALSTAIAPFVGQNWGEAIKIDRVEKAISISHKFSLYFFAVCHSLDIGDDKEAF